MLRIILLFLSLLTLAAPAPASAQVPMGEAGGEQRIAAMLVAEGPVAPGGSVTLAFDFRPAKGWHGYWKNPGDAGLGMTLEWDLPEGWSVSEPRYPVPTTLVFFGLMNHVYKQPYAVLVTLTAPEGVPTGNTVPIAVLANWLACSDRLCVPEQARLSVDVLVAANGSRPPGPQVTSHFDRWRQALPAPLDQPARYQVNGDTLRLAVPLPAAVAIGTPHLFAEQKGVVDPAAAQRIFRNDDALVFELQRRSGAVGMPDDFDAVVRLDEAGNGLALRALPGEVPRGGTVIGGNGNVPLALLIVSAIFGGILLNILPCVFPILSLKALALLRHGGDEATARREGLAYTAGTTLAALSLGGLLLALRASGEQIGWAFQLQEPAIVALLALLSIAIAANLMGLYAFAIPGLGERGSIAGETRGAFATGLLASFVATPCTGPFMAAALGAALLLPLPSALALFAALGFGLGLPFLLLGYVPPLRRALPRPGPWMETFRRWMSLPMGLTAIALLWLSWRMGGLTFLLGLSVLGATLLGLLIQLGRRQHDGSATRPVWLAGLALAALAALVAPRLVDDTPQSRAGLLDAQAFSAKTLEEALGTGRPVFVWMTADWCVSCKVNEARAIETQETRDAFEKAGVIVLRGDWTRRDPEITRYLTARGAAGVPLYVWYDSGKPGTNLPQLLSSDTLIHRARGTEPSR